MTIQSKIQSKTVLQRASALRAPHLWTLPVLVTALVLAGCQTAPKPPEVKVDVPLLYKEIKTGAATVQVAVAPQEFSNLTSASFANNGIAMSLTEVLSVDLLGELF